MNRPNDDCRLEGLFARYWDGALAPAESEELAALLASDPDARAAFRAFCLHAAVAAELPAAEPAARWSRRRALRWAGAAAAGLAGAALGVRAWRSAGAASRVVLAAATGSVKLRSAEGKLLVPAGIVPPGGTLATSGFNASVVLRYPDGAMVTFTGDSSAALAADGLRLLLLQGTATAEVPPQPADGFPLSLATAEATLSRLSGVAMTLGRAARGTEVGVQQGSVSVSAPNGEPLDVVRGGELLTLGAGGGRRKGQMPETPDAFALDLSAPLPEDWELGRRETGPDGPALRPEFWLDPFHGKVMSQIRSHKSWCPGFFRAHPDSVVRVRYRVDRPGPGQVVAVVRTASVSGSATGCLEWNGTFGGGRAGQWQWLEVKGRDLLDNAYAPRFGPPWVGFLLIFNTYLQDIGLRVAEYRVERPRGPASG